jgi:hypothetical protein
VTQLKEPKSNKCVTIVTTSILAIIIQRKIEIILLALSAMVQSPTFLAFAFAIDFDSVIAEFNKLSFRQGRALERILVRATLNNKAGSGLGEE